MKPLPIVKFFAYVGPFDWRNYFFVVHAIYLGAALKTKSLTLDNLRAPLMPPPPYYSFYPRNP